MRTPHLALRITACVSILAISLLAHFALSHARGQAPTQSGGGARRQPLPRPPYFGGPTETRDNAAMAPELTYTNSAYGLSFRFPGDFSFQLYSDLEQAPRGKSHPHSDPGEVVLATLVLPNRSAAPSIMTVGVNTGISEELCAYLVTPDQWTSGPALTLGVNGVKFAGRNEVDRSRQFGMQNSYRRQYTAYSHRTCFEFESNFATLDPSRTRGRFGLAPTPVDLDQAFAEMELILQTVKIQTPNLGTSNLGSKSVHVSRPWETSLAFPKELASLDDLTDWKITYPPPVHPFSVRGVPRQFKICGEGDYDHYLQISFVGGAGPELDDAAANAAVDKLNSGVIQLLRRMGWKLMNSSPGGSTSVCYGKNSVYVTTGDKGTDRCTMNSPCNVSDLLSVNVYIPTSPVGTQ